MQQSVASRLGHAIEARLYAEDPVTFLPQSGRIEQLVLPGNVRVDAGVEAGDVIGTGYDPMIAKLVARGATRDTALDELAQALAETEVAGLVTNLPFLRWLVSHPAFRAGDVSTAFLVEHPPLSAPPLRTATGAFSRSWRLNLPAPPPAPPPDLDAAAQERRAGGSGGVTAPMPGTVIAIHVAPGDAVVAATAARDARGDEDGAPGDRAVRRHSGCGARRRRRRRRRRGQARRSLLVPRA